MDSTDPLQLDPEATDSDWEAYYRRNHPDRDWYRNFDVVPAWADDNEIAWDDIRRRERMAQAIYDC